MKKSPQKTFTSVGEDNVSLTLSVDLANNSGGNRIAQRDRCTARAEEILEAAASEDREITADESAEIDLMLEQSEKLDKQIRDEAKARERIAKLRQPVSFRQTQPGVGSVAREYAQPRRHFNTKHFKPDQQETAYRFGMWCAATLGRPFGVRFCQEQGIPLIGATQEEDTNTAGGYLVPIEFDNVLIDLREQYGVFRKFSGVKVMKSDTKDIPRRTGGLTAYFVGEGTAGTKSTKTWDQVELIAKKMMAVAVVTNELSEDAIINVADDIAGEIAYAFANKEDDCGFNGDGTSTYGGIVGVRSALTNLSGTIANIAGLFVGTGNLYSELVLSDFNNVVAKLPQFADTPNARWFVHKTFYHSVMEKLATAAGGVTETGIANGSPRRFLGYDVVMSQVMPKTEANSQVCALFGDLALASKFGDRRMTSIAFSDSATIGSTNMFETDSIAIRGTERFDINVHDVGNASATAASRTPGPIVGLITAAS